VPDRLTSSELECLSCYMPSGWRERVGPSLAPEALAECISHLQALLATVSTYLPMAILADDRDVRVERITDTFAFEAAVSDDGGVHRVVIAYEEDGGRWRTMDLVRSAVSSLWLGELEAPLHRLGYFVQAVDDAGNVALGANKGLMFEASPNMLFLPVVFKRG